MLNMTYAQALRAAKRSHIMAKFYYAENWSIRVGSLYVIKPTESIRVEFLFGHRRSPQKLDRTIPIE